MPWQIRWSERAFRDMSGLDKPIARRIVAKLEAAAVDPPRFFQRLVGADEHKLRVGDHRVLVLLSFETETFLVARVGHRSSIYRE